MIKRRLTIVLLTLIFTNISFSQVVADYHILIIQGNTTTHEDVTSNLDAMGHTVTAFPHASVTDGFDFSPYDVAMFMWDTPMSFTGYPDLIAENELCNIGIISMSHFQGMDSLFIGKGNSWTDQPFSLVNNSHWITEPWDIGALPLDFTYKTKLTNIPTDHVTVLGLTGSDSSLVVDDIYKRASAVYYGHTAGMPWNTDASNLLDRIICWAAADCCELTTEVTLSDYIITADQDDAEYQWIDCADNSEIDGATDQSFEPAENGSYAVIITTDDVCSDTSECVTIADLSINNNGNKLAVEIFPNPSNGQFNIISKSAELGTVHIFDSRGKLIMETEMANELTVDLQLESGVYFIKYTSSKRAIVSQIIIE